MSTIPGDRNQFTQQLFTTLPAHYNLLAEVLSLGQNRRWRRAMVDRIVPGSPRTILDVACGAAGVTAQLAERTAARVIGLDLTDAMLQRGQDRLESRALTSRVQLVAGRAEQLPFGDGAFDALTFTYLLRYVVDPEATLAELARVVRPGGVMASHEFFVPPNRFWRAWWWGFTRAVLPVGGLLVGGSEWYRVGRFLGPNISTHYRTFSLPWTVEAWRRAGFENVGVRVMSLGGGVVMWGTRRGD